MSKIEPCSCGKPETWASCPNTIEYLISDHGRVRYPGYKKCVKGWVSGGAKCVRIKDISEHPRIQVAKAVHRLVMKAFKGATPAGLEIAHLDGDVTNNHLGNLCFVTHSENERHKLDHGTMVHGELQHMAKLDWDDVFWIRTNADYWAPSELAEKYGVATDTIRRVISRKTWKHEPPRILAAARAMGLTYGEQSGQ